MSKLYNKIFSHLKSHGFTDQYLLSILPRSYKRVGHIAIINLDDRLIGYKKLIGQTYLLFLSDSIRSIARFVKAINGEMRRPTIELLAGDENLDTVHIEYKTKFFLNPSKVMFSAGNHNERKRIVEFVSNINYKSPIVVLDMFACVGNLSLPLAIHLNRVEIIALEINNEATFYLKKSLELNKIPETKYNVILGDNRSTTPRNVADLVIMGYFGIDKMQLQNAIKSLNSNRESCLLMIHDIGNKNKKSLVMIQFNQLLDKDNIWKLKSIKKHKIKSIGPGLEHWVFDCTLNKKKI